MLRIHRVVHEGHTGMWMGDGRHFIAYPPSKPKLRPLDKPCVPAQLSDRKDDKDHE